MEDFKEMKAKFWRYKAVQKCSSNTYPTEANWQMFFYMYINFRSYFDTNRPNCIDASVK